ncbi:hypothetical protein [Bradyrhizobium sp. Rc2d]|uniref:hypothetical protein n=1 Tax=Bradyrhizobium sp. Rc2d TaxID=1855321 RepID=UPI00115FCCD1|nr:hypothetical protein [Bradyrhizobium sp. Rc2d]
MKQVGLSVLTDHVADLLRNRWKRDDAQRPDVDWLKNEVGAWLSSQACPQTHFIPCKISSQTADSFDIGPVTFVHMDNFAPQTFGLKLHADGQPVNLERWKTDYRADWIAVVDVTGREKERSLEVAEMTVDLCLGALQTVTRDPRGRDISRLTGRTMFDHKLSLVSDPTGFWSHGWRARQSFDMPGPILGELLQQTAADIQNMGRIIGRFKDESSLLPLLEQGWCDALFWFHEGLSEPLDSVAITKMETAIENLFCAESAKGSRTRLLQGFKSLFGVDGPSQFDAILPVTVDEFVEAIVTARSRILHGTWSTLANRDGEVERRDVARLTQNFIMISARAIEAYGKSFNPTDNVDALLAWAEKSRRNRS